MIIKKNYIKALIYLYASFSVMWTLIEGFVYLFPSLNLSGSKTLLVIVIIGAIYTIITLWYPSEIKFKIHHTHTFIEIKFGDIFEEDGYRVIGVSEFFESEIGIPVAEKSLHGKFLLKHFKDNMAIFDMIIEKELMKIPSATINNKSKGKKKKYPIGTTAKVNINNDKYLCLSLTKTDINTCKVSLDVSILWESLQGLWNKARILINNEILILPLVGSGVSGIGIPPRDLLNIIILSIITETKIKHITGCIKIVLTKDLRDEIDLKEIKNFWA